MADLRVRIRQGEVQAFLDPELPLMLLAEPGASWWTEGVLVCVARMQTMLDEYNQADAWTTPILPPIRNESRVAHMVRYRAAYLYAPPEVEAVIAVLKRFDHG